MGLDEFPEEPRLANAGLSHDRRYLPAPDSRQVQGLVKLLHLVVAADETCEAARGGELKARAYRRRSGDFVDFSRSA